MLLGGLFSRLVDQRRVRGKRYQHEPLLCALLPAVLSGATSLRKMGLFIKERVDELNSLFGTSWKKAPTWVGIRRFLLKIDRAAIEEVVRRHPAKQLPSTPEIRFIAMDGKALQGGYSRLMHCTAKKTRAIAHSVGADVLVQVKENQLGLLATCQMLPKYRQSVGQHVDCDKGHGRIQTRAVSTFVPPDEWLPHGWQSMVQAVVRVQRVVKHKRKVVPETIVETAWWISTIALSEEQYQHAIRGHWGVENQNQYVRDVVLFENVCRAHEQPGIFARLRSIALNCLRAKDVPSISRAIYRNTLNFNCAVTVAQRRT